MTSAEAMSWTSPARRRTGTAPGPAAPGSAGRPRQPPVAQTDLVLLAGLATEAEADGGALHADVPVAQGGQAEGAVQAGVLVVADPDEGHLEQPDDGGQDLLARRGRAGRGRRRSASRIAGSASAKASIRSYLSVPRGAASGRGSGTACGPRASRPVACRWPSAAADPDVRPGRRDGQGLDPGQLSASRTVLPSAAR